MRIYLSIPFGSYLYLLNFMEIHRLASDMHHARTLLHIVHINADMTVRPIGFTGYEGNETEHIC